MSTTSIGIAIQGPTNYYKKLLACYHGHSDIVWSTWKSEPQSNLDQIREAGITLILNDEPSTPGIGYINYQCVSAYTGLQTLAAREKYEYVMKVRSDLIFNDVETLRQNTQLALKDRKLAFISSHKLKGGYLIDYIVAGKAEDVLEYWKPEIHPASGAPHPEQWLQDRYFGIQNNWNQFIDKNVALISFKDLSIYSLKYKYFLNEHPRWFYGINNPDAKNGYYANFSAASSWLYRKYIRHSLAKKKTRKELLAWKAISELQSNSKQGI
ncbi:MAG: hypothetical protein KDD53_00535 [Bdellovibrionales bacterium]|nr:hypothetical protein [Bdellovibrionales bacterium]